MMTPLLPPEHAFRSPEEVAAYAVHALELLGLRPWRFGFDRAVRRLGACHPSKCLITLSKYFTAVYLREDPAQIHRTLLHELAHALAWQRHRSRGHGAVWQHYCAALGIAGEKSVAKTLDFSPRPPRSARFVLCHDESGEVFRRYIRAPRHRAAYFRRCYIPGRKEETLGHLVIRPITPEETSSV